MILSLDPSTTKTGYCIRQDDGKIDAGILTCSYSPDPIVRSYRLAHEVELIIREFSGIEFAIVESPPKFMKKEFGNKNVQWAAYGAVMYVVQSAGINHASVDPSTWTRGRAKDVWAFEIRRRFKLSDAGDTGCDAAAAVAILDWWMRFGRQRAAAV